ncbi:hypothetical protein BDR03DRAFT_968984 [Suillus americanus]|nr:hypothetical protein BDR03DRAFT_968984 [Suillus americanus]
MTSLVSARSRLCPSPCSDDLCLCFTTPTHPYLRPAHLHRPTDHSLTPSIPSSSSIINVVDPLSLNNLATRCSTRFHHRGNNEGLDQAIALLTEVLAFVPVHRLRG